MFNEICINEEMLPKYTYFKLHDPAAHKYNSTLEYRRDLGERETKVLGIHTTMDNT